MPIPFIAGAALAGGSMLFNAVQNKRNAQTQFDRQKELENIQFQHNKQLQEQAQQWQSNANDLAWQRELDWANNEREYNTPVAQLGRLRAAGINPATAYQGIENTSSNPLDMSAAAASGASVSQGSASMPQSVQFPDLMGIINGLKGLQLANSQIKETDARTNYYNTLSENVEKDIEKKTAYSPFWSDIALYDRDYKKYGARNLYRDILQKVWNYKNLYPTQLQKIASEIEGLDLTNDFNRQSFGERLNEIINRNANIKANTSYYSDLKRNIDSQIGFRDFQADQMEKNGAVLRPLYQSQTDINNARKQILDLQKNAQKDLENGNYVEALKKMTMLNFMQQALSGSLFQNLPSLPSPANIFDGDIGAVGKILFF